MKRVLFLFFLCNGLHAAAQPVDSLRQIVDTAIDRMEQYALHRREINWADFRRNVYQETKGISNLDSLLNKFPLFFKWINDFHGAIGTNSKWIKWREGRPSRELNVMMDSIFNKGPYLKVERWGDIGYFRVPAVGGLANEIPARTQRLVDSLCKINPSTVKAWIIDLRMNTGGNVWPMLTSLAALIGDGKVGGIKYMDGKPDATTFIKEGKPFGNNQFYSIPGTHCELPKANVPVVVLTGPMTGSSGEVLLLAFKGRANTIIMGEPTAGYVTSNSNYELHPGVNLFLATGYMQDRSGKYYTNSIEPDVFIKDGDNLFELQKDQKVQAAIDWLKTQAVLK